jgi:peptide/nickel transport system permease protein
VATTESSMGKAEDAEIVQLTGGVGPTPSDEFVVPPGVKQPRQSAFGVFRSMPILAKLGVIWLFFIFAGAIYAQLDARVFNGSLPLADPNLQLNNFNPATGTFGTAEVNESPSWAHPLGTDALARDTFSRAVHGSYVSVVVAIVSVMCGVIFGGVLGSLVGFVRGKTETVFMSMIDVLLAFPALVLLLALISIFEVRSLIGLLSIPAYMRVSRANSLAISNREFVMAAQAIGTKKRTILWREIIPNVMPTLIAYAMVAAAGVIVVEGALSFLGLSVQLPQATWGNMINQGRRDIKSDFGQILYPALILTFTVLALNQVGDFLQRRSAHRASSL